MTALIRLDCLGKTIGDKRILHDVSFDVEQGQVVSIIGPSGAGKSTTLRCINELEDATEGKIYFKGKALQGGKPEKRELRRHLGMVFQNFNLFPNMTALENIASGPRFGLKESKESTLERAQELLDRVGLSEQSGHYPSQLSGGQQQRVAIARALAMKPEAVLFDEPTSALDPELVGEVLKVMTDLAHDGMTMIIVTHEMNFARNVSDKLIVMADGSVIEAGTPESVFTNPSNTRTQSFLKNFTQGF